jgi:hypothetical protein
VAVKRLYEWDCVGVSCRGDRLLRALTMASQAERLLCVFEAGPSTCERSVSCRKRKFQLLPFHAAVRMRMLELPLTEFKGSTRDSRIRIRAPGRRGFLGIRKDKNANEVVREKASVAYSIAIWA